MAKKRGKEIEMIDHIITQEDLDANPDLVLQGIEIGETVQIPQVTSDDVIEEVVEDASNELPSWARSEGVTATKEEAAAFKTVAMVKPVKKEDATPEWAKA